MTKHLSVSWVVLCLVAGCELLPTVASDDATGDTGSEAGDPGGEGEGQGEPEEPAGGWAISGHPCFGYRTDTLWVDDADHLWLGCGSNAEGYGLYRSSDGGQTWDAPETDPPAYLEGMRVSSISRSTDGVLYVAGTHGSEQVVAVDTSVEPYVVSEVFTATWQVWDTFHVGGFRRNSAGYAVAESLTGGGLVYRTSDADPWHDGEGWWGGSSFYQILDLTLHDDEFYGVGSTISQPPTVYLPPRGGQDPSGELRMSPIVMVEGLGAFAGELWGLDVDDHGVVAAGVNQDRDVGYLFLSGADPWDLEAWRTIDVSTLLGDDPTWMRGVCRNGPTIVALGEYSRDARGIVLMSADDGATWTDETPAGIPPVHRCEVLEDGTVLVGGGEGFFGVWRP